MHYNVVHEDRSIQLAALGGTQVGPGARGAIEERVDVGDPGNGGP